MDTREWDAVIIGGGTAGLSAAQMLGRAGRRTLVIDEGAPRNRVAARLHGVLGHDGRSPVELLRDGRREAESYGVVVEAGTVTQVCDGDESDGGVPLRITRADGTVDLARAVIVASGIRDELPAIPGLRESWGTLILHCPYCHGHEVSGRRLGVLMTSPQSLHQVELVRQWSPDITAFTGGIPLEAAARARLVARGIRTVDAPVLSVDAADGDPAPLVVTDTAGHEYPLDALFAAPTPIIDLDVADTLDLARTEQPGAPLAVDVLGQTSHPRVWAAGNVVAPFANIPVAMGAGSMAGAAVNAALVMDDAARAVEARRQSRNAAWEERYAASDRFWSGRVNATLAAVVEDLPPGSVLEIGCGEGADAIWLAERGWSVTATDVAASAIARAQSAAAERGLSDDRVRLLARDTVEGLPEGSFDLVVSSFLHSWEEDFPRIEILRAATDRVAPGGRMLAISHAAPPPWAREAPAHLPPMFTPEEELEVLALDPDVWVIERADLVPRATVDPDGQGATLQDGVLLIRRR